MSLAEAPDQGAHPNFGEALAVWAKIGFLSFGGPAGQIALLHRVIVYERKWLDEETFLHALNFCMLLPGPEATQLATYAGWRLHGLKGGLAAGILFVLPGAAVVFALALGYALFGKLDVVEAAFIGVKAAVLVIVLEALLRVARRALKRTLDWVIAAFAFIAIFFFAAPFPLIIAAAAAAGVAFMRRMAVPPAAAAEAGVTIGQTIQTISIWLAIWFLPLGAITLIFGTNHVLSDLSLFFSKLAVVTFGGAYAVLAYMTQQAVETYGWLSAGEMLDGLGLAETTPGPLILVTEFVGFLAAWRKGGGNPFVMGALGAFVTLWATFVPCFLWIFTGAPYLETLRRNTKLTAALAGVTAAVVGVILNLSVWFAMHVLFADVIQGQHGWLTLWRPILDTLDLLAFALSIVALAAMFLMRLGIATTLALCAALAIGAYAIAQ